ncbi:MAG: SUF system Fe-S cluster assembly protein [Commensalibacter sp.]|nr:SUF system Fe-S cluster assembly protein [Commensalibacter sp.]
MQHSDKDLEQNQELKGASDEVRADTDKIDQKQSPVQPWVPDDQVEEQKNTDSNDIDENAIIDAISTVYDPEIPVNVYELGLIYAVNIHDDGRIDIEMTLTAPNCPSAQELPNMVKTAVEKVPNVKTVEVEIVWDPPWDVSRMSDEARLTLNMF